MSGPLVCQQCDAEYEEQLDRCPADGAPVHPREVYALLGRQLNAYEVVSILGRGGMGTVYEGRHVRLEKPVAIKVLHEQFATRKDAVEQFGREARAASRIRHPNIVDVTDFDTTDDGVVFLVMEYLEGQSLEARLDRVGKLDVFDAVNIVRQIARALGVAHDHRIVHRDLKPENIFLAPRPGAREVVRQLEDGSVRVEPEGDFDFVKLLDFGVAKFVDLGPGSHTRAGMIFGTPHYLSPEQVRAQPVDGRADLYALGVMFYQMVTATLPFDADSPVELLTAHIKETPQPPIERNPAIGEGTNRVILKCIEKDPADRYASMDELCDALHECVTDRVFVRDADDLSAAIRAGITPRDRSSREVAARSAGQSVDTGPNVAKGEVSRISESVELDLSSIRRRRWLWPALGVALISVAGAVWALSSSPNAGEEPTAAPAKPAVRPAKAGEPADRAAAKPSAPQQAQVATSAASDLGPPAKPDAQVDTPAAKADKAGSGTKPQHRSRHRSRRRHRSRHRHRSRRRRSRRTRKLRDKELTIDPFAH